MTMNELLTISTKQATRLTIKTARPAPANNASRAAVDRRAPRYQPMARPGPGCALEADPSPSNVRQSGPSTEYPRQDPNLRPTA